MENGLSPGRTAPRPPAGTRARDAHRAREGADLRAGVTDLVAPRVQMERREGGDGPQRGQWLRPPAAEEIELEVEREGLQRRHRRERREGPDPLRAQVPALHDEGPDPRVPPEPLHLPMDAAVVRAPDQMPPPQQGPGLAAHMAQDRGLQMRRDAAPFVVGQS